MILLDYNQICISNLMVQMNKNAMLDEDLVRHMVLNSIRLYKNRFSDKYGEIVICCDDKNYWRKDIFPYYKAHRKGDREKSPYDWNMIFECLNKIRDELKETFPYRVIRVERAEADDIIGTLCHEHGVLGFMPGYAERILILSGDKDFSQLQKYANVEQYSPMTKKWIRVNNPERYLREHIMRGDRGDGIPNFLSNDACLVNGERQKPLSTRKLNDWVVSDIDDFCDDMMKRNYNRNEMLVNLDLVPQHIQDDVKEQYDKYEVPEKRGLLNYFIKNRLKQLTEHIGEF